jgi:RNA polymerase sigma factor (sigma-70 family)
MEHTPSVESGPTTAKTQEPRELGDHTPRDWESSESVLLAAVRHWLPAWHARRDPNLVQSLAHDAYMRARDSYDGTCAGATSWTGWLRLAAYSVYVDFIRRDIRRAHRIRQVDGLEEIADRIACERASRSERLAEVEAALDGFSPRDRAIWWRAKIDEATHLEIAAEFETTVRAVAEAVYRVNFKLRTALGGGSSER